MFSGRPSVRPSVRTSVRPSRFVCVDISRTVRRFYIKLGMRVYPGGTILWVDFKVTGSKVTGYFVLIWSSVWHTMRHECVTWCGGRA